MADDAQAFLFNVEELFGSVAAQRMSFAEKGVYLVMLFQQWRAKERSLPDSPEATAELIAVTPTQTAEIVAAWDVVRRKFVCSKRTPGCIYNVKLEETRRRQRAKFRAAQSNGKKGGEAKARNRRQVKQIDAVANLATLESAVANPSEPLANPTVRTGEVRTGEVQRSQEERKESPPLSAPRDPFTDEKITERAGRFLERYAALYQQHRKGARYVPKPARDYAEAVTLCATWDDDARLDTLATIFLTTNHKFAEEGSRTVGQFRAMASWCDGLLAEHEAKGQA